MFKPKPDIAVEDGVEFLKRGGKPKVEAIQRHFNASSYRAVRLLDRLEFFGHVGPKKASKERQVFV